MWEGKVWLGRSPQKENLRFVDHTFNVSQLCGSSAEKLTPHNECPDPNASVSCINRRGVSSSPEEIVHCSCLVRPHHKSNINV